jgi:dihydrofolate reductase
MADLIYFATASLDGYVADERGTWRWSTPDEEVHRHINEQLRSIGTHLYGRKMYEVLVAWETLDTAGEPPWIEDFARIWRGQDKVVYSTTLDAVASTRTTLERDFDPETIRDLKATATGDLTVGGPSLAATALRAGLVDEIQFYLAPVLVGGGTPSLPAGVQIALELVDERRFRNGTVHMRYRIPPP